MSDVNVLRWSPVHLVCVLILIAGIAVGCGSEDSTTTEGSATGTGESASSNESTCAETASAEVEKATAPAELTVPSSPIPMNELAGKEIWYISPSQAVPFIADISKGFVAAAQAAGMQGKVFDGKGSPTTFNQGLSTAVAQNAAGIVLQGIDPKLVSGPLAQARKADIPVIDSFNGPPDAPLPAGVQAHVTNDFYAKGKVMGDYALTEADCSGTIVVFGSSVYAVQNDLKRGVEDEVKRLCPDCEVVYEDIDATSVATAVGTALDTTLRREPDISAIVALYDALPTHMFPVLERTGESIPIVGHDGVNLELVRTGPHQVADYAYPPSQYIGWAQVDQLARIMTGLPPEDANTIPSQLFDKENLPPEGDSLFPGYDDYEATYQKNWEQAP